MKPRFLALAAVAVLFAGCTKSGGNASVPSGTVPGTLRIAIQSDLKNLDPLLTSNTTDVMVSRLMFEPLLSANPAGDPVPMLAVQVPTVRNGGISKDGLRIVYHLRKDAVWSDGVPVTGKDVKWTWQAIMNRNNNVISQHGYTDIAAIDTPNSTTVVVHLKKKFAPFVNTFFAESDQPYGVAPAHVLSKYSSINNVPFNSDPNVSDGPFTFVRWVHGDHLEFAANPKFFMGAPKLKRIVVKIIPDENTAVNLLRTHEIDWMFEASISNYPIVKDIPGVRLAWVDVNGYEYMALNVQHPNLRDVRVRQAIAYSLDKQQIVKTLTFGQERVALEDQPPFLWSYDGAIKPYPTNLRAARALLKQAGWTPGAGGIMQKNGQQLSLVLVTNSSNDTRRKAVVQVQAALRKAGFAVQVKTYQSDVLFAPAGEGGILQGGKFDLGYAGWYAGIDPDDSSRLTCANVAPNGYNYSRYCNPQMEAAQRMALEHYDRATRKKAYARIQELLARDVPEIYIYYERQMHPISVAFKGFAPNPVTESWNAWQWSI